MPTKRLFTLILLLLSFQFLSINSYSTERDDNKIIIGVVNAVDSLMYVDFYTPFAKYIGEKLNRDYELRVLDYSEIANQLVDNKIDIGIFSPYSYIEAKINHPELNLFAIPKTHGIMGYHSIIVTNQQSDIQTLEDLAGKTLAFTHTNSTSGYQIPRRLFLNRNIKVEPIMSGGHKQSIELLSGGKIDAIATYEEAFTEVHKDINNFRIVYKFKIVPNNAIVISPFLNMELQESIKQIMYTAHQDIDIDKREMFANDFGIEQWVKSNDDFYNGLRIMLDRKRMKHYLHFSINPSENLTKCTLDDDILQVIEKRTLNNILSSDRFSKSKKNSSGTDSLSLDISVNKDQEYQYSIYLNHHAKALAKGILEYEDLIHLPTIVTNSLLTNIEIKTSLEYDPKSKYWFVPYGTDDGINSNNYDFFINNEQINSTESPIIVKSGICILPESFLNTYEQNKNLSIQYRKQESKWESKISTSIFDIHNLDNIWGITGLLVAFLTVLVTSLFQTRKQRRFKKKLLEANNLLKDYFEGKEITNKIVSLRANIGTLLEHQNIKEIQYNLLEKKITEIQSIVDSKSMINDQLKNNIEEIIADGVITEKEYQHLIHLMKKKNK